MIGGPDAMRPVTTTTKPEEEAAGRSTAGNDDGCGKIYGSLDACCHGCAKRIAKHFRGQLAQVKLVVLEKKESFPQQ